MLCVLSFFVYNIYMRKILFGLFAVFMSLGLACGSVFIIDTTIHSAQEQSVEKENEEDEEIKSTASGYWLDYGKGSVDGGEGTKEDPYIIKTARGLANFMWMVNDTSTTWDKVRDGYWRLEADIDLSAHYWTPIGSGAYYTTSGWWLWEETTWHPYYFSGTFDGNGHTVSGITINVSGASGITSKYVGGTPYNYGEKEGSVTYNLENVTTIGLFGLTVGATIKDLIVDRGTINIYSDGDDNKNLNTFVGSAVGLISGGTIENVRNKGVRITYTQHSSDNATAARGMLIGGVIGHSIDNTDISYCSNSADIEVDFDYGNGNAVFGQIVVAGVVGATTTSIEYCDCSADISIQARRSGRITEDGGLEIISGIVGYIVTSLFIAESKSLECNNNIFSGEITFNAGSNTASCIISGIAGYVINIFSVFGYYPCNIYNCINYGSITATNVYNTLVGGVLAINVSMTNIYGCSNFGDLNLTLNSDNCTESGYGGILAASSTVGTYIYNSANYGDINVRASKSIRNIGGIAGWIIDNGLITACINHGAVSGSSNSDSVGGIAGQIGKEYKKGSWFFDVGHEDAKTNVFISNCINYSNITGSRNYGQIVGFINGSDKVHNCYGNTSYTYGYGSSSSGTRKTYSSITKYSFFRDTDWVTTSYANYGSRTFNVTTSASNSKANRWYMSPLVYYYYSSTERADKGMSTNANQNIIVPMASVSIYSRAILQWSKPGDENNQSYSSEVGYIYYNVWNSTTNKIELKTITNSYTALPYLNGADYSVSYRAENLFWLEYNPSHWNFSKFEIMYSDSSEYETSSSYSIINGANGSNNKVYARFRNNSFIDSGYLRLKFTLNSIAQEVDVSTYVYKSYNSTNDKDIISSNNGGDGTVNYDTSSQAYASKKAYYLDEISLTAVPNVGYAVKKIESGSSTINNFNQSNSIDKPEGSVGSYTTSSILYNFIDFDIYFVPIVYEYNIMYNWDEGGRSGIISMKDTSSSDTLRKDLNFYHEDLRGKVEDRRNLYYFTLEYGYEYNFYLIEKTNNEPSSTPDSKYLIKSDITGYVEHVQLTADDLINALDNLPDSLNQKSFTIYVERKAIEYDIQLHNMITSYKDTDLYTEVGSDNFQTQVFGDMSKQVYKQYFGEDMPEYSNAIFEYFDESSLSINVTVEDKVQSKYGGAGYGYKSNYLVTYSLEKYSSIGSNPQKINSLNVNFSEILKTYIDYFRDKNESKLDSKTLDVYCYSDLQMYYIQGNIKIDGSDVADNSMKITLTTQENGKTELNYRAEPLQGIHYYAPVTLVASEPYGYDFVGWYLGDKLLSLDKEYTFVNNRVFKEEDDLTIIASYTAYDMPDSDYTENVNRRVYSVSSADDLVWLSEQVAKGNSFEGATFNQTADIDMSGIVFNPIGSPETPFKGIYNGKNYIIKNLSLINENLPIEGSLSYKELYKYNLSYRGLFGYVDGATIKNLTLKVESSDSSNKFVIQGYSYIGSFVGYAKNSTFENLNNYNYGIEAQNISYSTSIKPVVVNFFYDIYGRQVLESFTEDVELEAFDDRVGFGGLIGYAENCSLFACSSQGNVRGVEYVGGLVGQAKNSLIKQSYAIGKVDACDIRYSYDDNGWIRDAQGNIVLDSASYYFELLNASGTHILRSYGLGTDENSGDVTTDLIGTIVAGNEDDGNTIEDCFWSETVGNRNPELVGEISYDEDGDLDSNIWITVNERTRLKVFYWA